MISFNDWQNEPIHIKKHDDVPIKYVLHKFIDSILAFIHKNGYNIWVPKHVFENTIVSALYYLDYNRFHIFPVPNNVKYDESYDNFEFNMNWNDFWKSWNYNTYNFFEDAEVQILHVIWAYIDLDKSNAQIKYLESLEDSDSEEDTPRNMRNMDPYLLDQLNASNHYKFTRFENS